MNSDDQYKQLNIDEVGQRLIVQQTPLDLIPGVWWTEKKSIVVPVLGIIIGLVLVTYGLGAHYGPRRVMGSIREDPNVYIVFFIGFAIFAGSLAIWPRWIPKAFVFGPNGQLVRPEVRYGFSDGVEHSWRYLAIGISAVICMALFLLVRPGIGVLGAGPLVVFVLLSVLGFFDVFDRWRRSQRLAIVSGSWDDIMEIEYSPASQWGWQGDTSNGQRPVEPYDVFFQMADGTRIVVVRSTSGREFASALTVALKGAAVRAGESSFTADMAMAQARRSVENLRRGL